MAKPKIVLTANFTTLPSGLNVSTLTGGSVHWGGGTGVAPVGSLGGAWFIGHQGSENRGVIKAATGDRLLPSIIGTLTSIGGSNTPYGGWEIFYESDDTPDSFGSGTTRYDLIGAWNFNTNPAGLRFLADADQRVRKLRFFLNTFGGGWSAEASLSDGSFAMQTLALPNTDYSNACFVVDWIGLDAGGSLQLDIVRRASGASGLHCPFAYQEIPTTRRRQSWLRS